MKQLKLKKKKKEFEKFGTNFIIVLKSKNVKFLYKVEMAELV